jgi:hypothetical protein
MSDEFFSRPSRREPTIYDAGQMPISQLRETYRAAGLVPASALGWRALTANGVEQTARQLEIAALLPGDPRREEMLAEPMTAEHPWKHPSMGSPERSLAEDDARQLRLSLAESELVAIICRADSPTLAAAFHVPPGAPAAPPATPTILLHDGRHVHLFDGKGLGKNAARLLEIVTEHGVERIVPRTETTIPLPSRGTLEKWRHWQSGGAQPVRAWRSDYVLALCAPANDDLPAQLKSWLETNFERLGLLDSAKKGLSRGEIYAALLASGVNAEFVSEAQLSDAITACGFERKRLADGVKILIKRRAGALKGLNRVSVESLAPEELAAFRAWKNSRDQHPERIAARKAAAAERDRIAAMVSDQVRRFGSPERWKQLSNAGVIAKHMRREDERAVACRALAIPYVALDVRHAVPAWWDVAEYEDRVQRFAVKAQPEAAK